MSTKLPLLKSPGKVHLADRSAPDTTKPVCFSRPIHAELVKGSPDEITCKNCLWMIASVKR